MMTVLGQPDAPLSRKGNVKLHSTAAPSDLLCEDYICHCWDIFPLFVCARFALKGHYCPGWLFGLTDDSK